jgi:5-methylcytosine-specific restriction endonuclease McrA
MKNSNSLFRGNIKPDHDQVKEAVELLLPAFVYVGGYTGSDSSVTLACRECGAQIQRSMITIRKGKCTKVCPTCEAKAREERRQKEKEAKAAERLAAKQLKKVKEPRACKCCGSLFIPGVRSSYCSVECAKRVANNHKDRRLRGQAGKDWDITVPALVQRDNNTCYLCGGLCDSTDYRLTDEGYFIAGPMYPSVDHVIPVAKGGKHTWDNVKLSHLACNMKKRDTIL